MQNLNYLEGKSARDDIEYQIFIERLKNAIDLHKARTQSIHERIFRRYTK